MPHAGESGLSRFDGCASSRFVDDRKCTPFPGPAGAPAVLLFVVAADSRPDLIGSHQSRRSRYQVDGLAQAGLAEEWAGDQPRARSFE